MLSKKFKVGDKVYVKGTDGKHRHGVIPTAMTMVLEEMSRSMGRGMLFTTYGEARQAREVEPKHIYVEFKSGQLSRFIENEVFKEPKYVRNLPEWW